MSTFGNKEKDEIYESIRTFIISEKEKNPDIQIHEIMEKLMEVISYGIKNGIYEVENN